VGNRVPLGFCHLYSGASSRSHAYSDDVKTKHGSSPCVILTFREKLASEGLIAIPFVTYQFILSRTFSFSDLVHRYTWPATSGESVLVKELQVLP